MEFKLPLKYFEHNIIISEENSGGYWAAYKINGFNYDYQSDEAKISLLSTLVRLVGEPTEMVVYIVPRAEDTDSHFDMLLSRQPTNSPIYEQTKEYNDMVKMYVRRQTTEVGNDYTTYLLARITPSSTVTALKREVASFLAEPIRALGDFLSGTMGINELEIRQVIEAEKAMASALEKGVDITRLSTGETQWLLGRVMYRGIKAPAHLEKTVKHLQKDDRVWRVLTEDDSPLSVKTHISAQLGRSRYIRPNRNEVAGLFHGRLSCHKNKGVKVEHDDGSISYQSFLAVSGMPLEIQFPHREWLYGLTKLAFPVEVCIYIINVPPKEAGEMVRKTQQEIDSEIDNIRAARARIPNEVITASEQSQVLLEDIKQSKLSMCKVTVSCCVAAGDEETVEQNVTELKNYFEARDFVLSRPGSDQLKLFFQHIPGAGQYTTSYQKFLSPFMVCSGMFGVTSRIGDNSGPFVGWSKLKSIFLFLGQASLENKSPAATLYGNLGYGKSFAANILAYIHVLYGARALIIDPKGERSHWPERLPLIGKYVSVVDVSTDPRYRGTLDPFIIYKDRPDEAAELASSVICELLDISSKDPEFIILAECINRVRQLPVRSMSALILQIKSIPKDDLYYSAAVALSRQLAALSTSGTMQLLFGTGQEQAISTNNLITIIQTQNLSIPAADKPKKDYTQDERVSTVVMLVLAQYAKRFALMPSSFFKLILLDESWSLKNTSVGISLINFLTRMGRSLYCGTILNGHSVNDLPSEETQNTITYKFCFHTDNHEEAKRMLKYLKLDATPDNLQTLMTLGNGECLFSDQYGRVGKLKFDYVFEELKEAFSTTPKDNKAINTAIPAQQASDAAGPPTDEQVAHAPEEAPESVFAAAMAYLQQQNIFT